ncbi:long-chain fatty acid--CoA ligase [Cytobacillus horneckiae]|uniref:Long-chain fatty acid--CoA ligase n=1 Tax=Cytobacillus horneckiae TaxID=549687 RepID=A0A2N0ZLG9_9BACI|nr:long-chain fatty acid--CoA ligase [Cytobacillus horneckiae]
MKKGVLILNKPWQAFYPTGVPHEIAPAQYSIYQFLSNAAEQHPNKIAVKENYHETTYAELKRAVNKFAAALYENGFKKGDMFAIMLPNCLEYVISFYAVQRLGGTVVQVNPMYQQRELDYILEDSGATWLICNEFQKPKLKHIEHVICIFADGANEDKQTLYTWINKAENSPPSILVEVENDIAILQYTGGTTGRSKGVMITHQNVVCNISQNMITSSDLNSWERVIGIAPMFHAMGLTIMNTTVYNGGTYYPIKRFELDSLVETIKDFQPTIFSGSPTMFIALLNHPDVNSETLNSIKIFGSGSAPLSLEVMKAFEEKSATPIIESYGLSEATTMTHKNPTDQRKVGSIGIPVPSTDAQIVDMETGTKRLPIGEIGELIIKGPQIMKGYWRNKNETEKALRNGWLYTGDLAYMDEDGFFYISGRKKDMIIAGGYNIYPMEIEEVLYKLPAVKEVCVYGIPDSYRGETVKAAIVLKDGMKLNESEIVNWCNENLARYKVPRVIEFKTELPKTAVGKILRTKLIEMETSKL